MNYQWRSRESGRTTYNQTSSAQTPLSIRTSIQDAIPSGTVASRVRFLQSLAKPIPSQSHPPPMQIHRGEDSRTGFGQRLTNRFGKPALQNTKPDEPQVQTSLHSFLGLTNPRIAQEEQHAIADYRTKYARSPGINGQIIPDGMTVRSPHDAIAPWAVLSRSKRSRSMGRQVTDPEVDALQEINFSNHGRHASGSSRCRDSSDDNTRYCRSVMARSADTINSEASNATSSTTRRQSVRDLFKDYGIERPAGLASRDTSYDTGRISRRVRPLRQCHVCLQVNGGISISCFRCSHRLCSQCDAPSPLPESWNKEGFANQSVDNSGAKLASKENRLADQEPVNGRQLRPGQSPANPRRGVLGSAPKIPMPPAKLPNIPSTSLKKSSQAPKQLGPTQEGPLAIPVLSGSQVPTRVRDSPFLIADLLASSRSRPTLPVKAPVGNGLDNQGAQNHRLKQLETQNAASSSSDGNCKSPTCRATHYGHQPYRHAVSCIKKKRPRHVHKETDKGYSADTSRVEDTGYLHSDASYTAGQQNQPHSHLGKPHPHPVHPSALPAVDSESLCKQEVREVVECHGYPRTGHSRLGSPVSSGVIGECQHRLHDCHCAACQSTYHSVRCCLHVDHQARVHHHLTPQKDTSASEKDVTAPPLGGPKICDKLTASKSVAAVSTSSDHRFLAVTTKLPRESTRQDQPVQKPALVKMPSLPRSKTSSLMAGTIAKPPTPPPWVSSPRRGSKSGVATMGRWKKTRREEVDSALGVEPLEDSPPPFKEKPSLPLYHSVSSPHKESKPGASMVERRKETRREYAPIGVDPSEDPPSNFKERPPWPPPAPDEESRPEFSRRRSNGKWTTGRSHNVHDRNDKQDMPCRRPSRSSIVEKHSRPPSRMQVSPPGSRRASRRLSALFQLREKDTVPLLNQKLLEHQEELRRRQKACDDQMANDIRSSLDDFTWNNEHQGSIRNSRPEPTERAESPGSADSMKTYATRKKKWRLRLVDRKPSPACGNDVSIREHRLNNDEVASDVKPQPTLQEKQTELPTPDTKDHNCVWKSKVLEQKKQGLGRQGVTVLLHLERREDVIFKTADWTGGEERAED